MPQAKMYWELLKPRECGFKIRVCLVVLKLANMLLLRLLSVVFFSQQPLRIVPLRQEDLFLLFE